ncbi:hypothetical protein FRC04_001914 [Tulasnella sp. 424]|nr:hypothetical protein FRC04_001914 [Tulasnella sp. 424]KAG8977692.1 hypothetical protein FRC05_000948 [Tulasnella sp. 425]
MIFMHWIYPGTEPPRDTGDWKPFIKSSKPKREENLLPINGATRPMRPLENTPATDWKPKKSGSTFDELPVPIKVENTADQPPSTAKVRATRNTQPSRNASKARKTRKRGSESATEKPPYPPCENTAPGSPIPVPALRKVVRPFRLLEKTLQKMFKLPLLARLSRLHTGKQTSDFEPTKIPPATPHPIANQDSGSKAKSGES